MNRSLFVPVSLSIGFSCACFLDVLILLCSPRHDVVQHLVGPASALFVPALVNVAALSLACFLLLYSVRSRQRSRRCLVAGLFALLPWIVTKNVCFLFDVHLAHRVSMSLFLACFALFILLVSLSGLEAHRLGPARPALRFVSFGLAATGLLFCMEVAGYGVAAHDLNRSAPSSLTLAQRPGLGRGRIVWVVLDELGYQQVYGDRLPGLRLPNFDALRNQSTLFTNVTPAGLYTEVVIPELLTGEAASGVHTSANGRHLALDQGSHRVAFSERNTVFADADRLGYRNAVVGWYVPYCRLLQGLLSSCYWTGQTSLSNLFPAHTILPNLFHPALRLLRKLPYFFFAHSAATPDEIEEGKLHFADYVAIHDATQAAIEDRRNDFVLLHAPIPHPEGIWNRDTHSFAVNHSAYVDNLSLADDYLGEIITCLQRQGEWNNATIVLMGDHAWRTQLLWVHSRSWQVIDQEASEGGKFDSRPAYLIKLPNQTAPAVIPQQFEAIRTRTVLDQLLARTITTSRQLQDFVADGK